MTTVEINPSPLTQIARSEIDQIMPKRFLYICTHNRCRSIIAEAVTNKLAGDRIIAVSAGSQASGEVHPLTIQFLYERGLECDDLHSQSWDEFEDFKPNAILTMCDQAATETCPKWFGATPTVHWGLSDPSKSSGDIDQLRTQFFATIDEITRRVNKLLTTDFDNVSNPQLAQLLRSAI